MIKPPKPSIVVESSSSSPVLLPSPKPNQPSGWKFPEPPTHAPRSPPPSQVATQSLHAPLVQTRRRPLHARPLLLPGRRGLEIPSPIRSRIDPFSRRLFFVSALDQFS